MQKKTKKTKTERKISIYFILTKVLTCHPFTSQKLRQNKTRYHNITIINQIPFKTHPHLNSQIQIKRINQFYHSFILFLCYQYRIEPATEIE